MKTRSTFFLILFACFFLFIIVSVVTRPVASVNFATDHYYHFLYSIKKEDGNSTINSIVSQTEEYNKSPQRLTKIAVLISQNFSDYWWVYQREERFCQYNYTNGTIFYGWCSPLYGTPFYNFFEKNPNAYRYVSNKIGNVTIRETNDT